MFRLPSRILLLMALAALSAWALPTTRVQPGPTEIPAGLLPWIPWVLRDLGDSACPGTDEESKICLALSRLELRADKLGATFSLTGVRYSRGQVPLPGDSAAWPMEVRDGAARIPTIGDPSQSPFVERPAGPFKITGRLGWKHRPSSLTLPDDIAVHSLTVDGKPAAWDAEAKRMWLEEREEEELEAPSPTSPKADTIQSLQIRVFRHVIDGSPMELTTTLQLVVGGRERRIVLDSVVPADAIALSLDSPLAGRMNARGGLELTLRPGTWEVSVTAALRGTPKFLRASANPSPWPAKEVWSFRESPNLRGLAFAGAPTVDPVQAGLDRSQQNDPTWSLERGHPLSVTVVRQGTIDPDSLKVELSRKIWIDAEGSGATVQDDLQVRSAHPLRLAVAAPLVAGRILIDNQAQLITTTQSGEGGANLGAGFQRVEVVGRVDGNWKDLPASSGGWRLNQARFEVQAPPGWWILHLSGPAGAVENSTWISSWTLNDVFWIAFIAALFLLSAGRLAGTLALATLVLGRHDHLTLEPWFVLGLVLFVRSALAKRLASLGEGGTGPWLRNLTKATTLAAGLALVWCLGSGLAYSSRQWIQMVHPSAAVVAPSAVPGFLQRSLGRLTEASEVPATPAIAAPAAEAPFEPGGATETRTTAWAPGVMQSSVMDRIATASDGLMGEDVEMDKANLIDAILAGGGGDRAAREGVRSSGMRSKGDSRLHAVRVGGSGNSNPSTDPFLEGSIPTGPGIPAIQGSTSTLECSNSPPTDARIRIWAAGTQWVRLLRLLGLLLGAALWHEALRKARGAPKSSSAASMWTGIFKRPSVGTGMLVLAMVLGAAANGRAQTAFPTQAMLDELKQTLTKPAPCGENCADITMLRLQARGSEIRVQMVIEALDRTAVFLPRGDWKLSDISCGRCAVGAEESKPWVMVEAGIQTVELVARTTGSDLVLSFPVRPRQLEIQTQGWKRQDEGRESVRLVRSALGGQAEPEAEPVSDAPRNLGASPFVRIERHFAFEHEWTVLTRVVRASQFAGAIAVSYPLLAGETSLDGQAVDSGKARWVLPAGADQVEFRTQLRHDDTLLLVASEGPWSEQWHATSLSRLFLVARGLSPVGQGEWEWTPFPGERLKLSPRAYPAATGSVATVQSATLAWTEDAQGGRAELEIEVLVSQATEITLRLPEGIRMGEVTRDRARVFPTQLVDGRWSLPLSAHTSNVHFNWQSDPSGLFFHGSPKVELSIPGVNFRTINTPANGRFALASGGEGRGVRMIWWAFLPIFALAILLLVRSSQGALRRWPTLMLLLPATTLAGISSRWELVSIPLLVATLWWRRSQNTTLWSRPSFMAIQIGLVLIALHAGWSLLRLLLAPLQGIPDFGPVASDRAWSWVLDRSTGALPATWILSLPLWSWKALMGIWSLWVLRFATPWIRRGWTDFGCGGMWPASAQEVEIQKSEAPTHLEEDQA